MNFLEHLKLIEEAAKKAEKEKLKKELFGSTDESAEDLYIKSCGADE